LVVERVTWTDAPFEGDVVVQCSAHGATHRATTTIVGDEVTVRWHEPQRAVAPGQTIVFYDPADEVVLGGGIAAS